MMRMPPSRFLFLIAATVRDEEKAAPLFAVFEAAAEIHPRRVEEKTAPFRFVFRDKLC
jgi:hypothetical protein